MESPTASSPIAFRSLATYADLDANFFPNPEPLTALDYCIQALNKPSSDRTPEDLDTIVTSLKSFRSLIDLTTSILNPDNGLIELANKVSYQYFSAGDVIYHKGDNNDNIYLVLSGSTVLFNELFPDVFKPLIVTEESKEDDKLPESPALSKLRLTLMRTSSIDETYNSKVLFHPKFTQRTLKKLTSLGDISISPTHNNSSVGVVPTVHEVKSVIVENFVSGSPEHKSLLHLEPVKHHHDWTEFSIPKDQKTNKRVGLYRLLAHAEKEKPMKYIRDGQFLYHAKQKIGSGMYFGDMVSRVDQTKIATAVALDEVHVMTFKADDFISIFNNTIGNMNNTIKFLEPFFPDASYPKLVKLLNLFEECEFRNKQVIFEEESAADYLYFIKEGEIQLVKSVETHKLNATTQEEKVAPSGAKKRFCIATVHAGEAFGEEDFFSAQKRYYSAVVSSGRARLLRLSLEIYKEISDLYKGLFESMMKIAQAKTQFKKEQTMSTVQQLINSVQQKEESRQRTINLAKVGETRVPDTLLHSRTLSLSKAKSKESSPYRTTASSPKGEGFGDISYNFSEEIAKKTKGTLSSPIKLPVLSPKANESFEVMTKFFAVSPQNQAGRASTTGTKKPSSPKAGEFDKGESPTNKKPKPVTQKLPKKDESYLFTDEMSIFKDAASKLGRKRPEDISKTKVGPMSSKDYHHKLYYGELEKSLQMMSKYGLKESISDQGFVSVGVSKIEKPQNNVSVNQSTLEIAPQEVDESPRVNLRPTISEKVKLLPFEKELFEKYKVRKMQNMHIRVKSMRIAQMEQVSMASTLSPTSQKIKINPPLKSNNSSPKGSKRSLEKLVKEPEEKKSPKSPPKVEKMAKVEKIIDKIIPLEIIERHQTPIAMQVHAKKVMTPLGKEYFDKFRVSKMFNSKGNISTEQAAMSTSITQNFGPITRYKSTSPVFNERSDGENEENNERVNSLEDVRSMRQITEDITPWDVESFEVPQTRAGFKPSKVLSLKMSYKSGYNKRLRKNMQEQGH